MASPECRCIHTTFATQMTGRCTESQYAPFMPPSVHSLMLKSYHRLGLFGWFPPPRFATVVFDHFAGFLTLSIPLFRSSWATIISSQTMGMSKRCPLSIGKRPYIFVSNSHYSTFLIGLSRRKLPSMYAYLLDFEP